MKQLRLIILFSILSLSVTVRAMEEQSVSLDTPTGKINGKIGLPDAEKPPIVLLIAGSGPTDMDGNTNSSGFSMKNNRDACRKSEGAGLSHACHYRSGGGGCL